MAIATPSTTAGLRASAAPTTSLAPPLATPQPTPVIGPPVGVFEHTGGFSEALVIAAILFPILSAPIIILRLWASKSILKKWHIDDSTFSSHHYSRTWGGVPLYNLTTIFIKASVLMFYLRFSITAAFRIVTYAVIFIVVAYSIINIAATFALDCANNAACDQLFRVYIACAAMNVLTDFAILLLPFWLLHPMRVRFARKVGIALILMAGGFVLGVSIYRLIITILVDEEADVTYGWGESIKWWYAALILPSVV
ncbi:hypothetical protein ACJ41O_000113 [Fusarium nematophilum]